MRGWPVGLLETGADVMLWLLGCFLLFVWVGGRTVRHLHRLRAQALRPSRSSESGKQPPSAQLMILEILATCSLFVLLVWLTGRFGP